MDIPLTKIGAPIIPGSEDLLAPGLALPPETVTERING